MPGFDASGPMGQGMMTGRGMGRCNTNVGSDSLRGAEYQGLGCRRGFGGGRGGRFLGRGQAGSGGYGRGTVGAGQTSQTREKEALQEQARQLQESLEDIRRRLSDLDVE